MTPNLNYIMNHRYEQENYEQPRF